MDIVQRMQTETCCAQIGSAHIGESGYADALCSKELFQPLPTALLAHPADADTAEESVHSRIRRAVDQGLSGFECFGDTVGAFKVVCENLPRQPIRSAVQSDRKALSGAGLTSIAAPACWFANRLSRPGCRYGCRRARAAARW